MSKAVEISKAYKVFGSLVANDNVDFDVDYGQVHALIGENGAGKTTLMRALYGMYKLDGGVITVGGKELNGSVKKAIKAGIAMVHQNFMQIGDMSVVENVILGNEPRDKLGVIKYSAACEKVQQLSTQLNMTIKPNQTIKSLSIGERQKVEIIKALFLGAKIIIFDEPTAVLTPQESDELFEVIRVLKENQKAIIYISHKLNEVVKIADRTTVMRKGKVVARWDSMENVSRTQLAEAMVGKSNFSMVVGDHTASNQEKILTIENLTYYDQSTKLPLINHLSLVAHKGEILGIGGVEGNGQQELISLLVGAVKQDSGRIIIGEQDLSNASTRQRREAGLGYISEDRMQLGVSLEATLQENYICGWEENPDFSHHGLLKTASIDKHFESVIQEFDIYGAKLGAAAKTLSGGNLQKVILAREIKQHPKILIAAHPTRGLDIGAINFVRTQLIEEKKAGTCVLLITADLEELMALSDRILVMYEGGFSGEITDTKSVTEAEIGLYMGGISKSQEEGGEESA